METKSEAPNNCAINEQTDVKDFKECHLVMDEILEMRK
jgi:hypothetical protein